MGSYRIVGHTADVALELTGSSGVDLFQAAARGFYRLIVEGPRRELGPARGIQLGAGDLEELLVKFLSELLFHYATDGFLAARIVFERWETTALVAALAGERFDPAVHRVVREVKAVTHHGLKIERAGGRLRARVIFDV